MTIVTIYYKFTTEILAFNPRNIAMKLCYYAPFLDEFYRR